MCNSYFYKVFSCPLWHANLANNAPAIVSDSGSVASTVPFRGYNIIYKILYERVLLLEQCSIYIFVKTPEVPELFKLRSRRLRFIPHVGLSRRRVWQQRVDGAKIITSFGRPE